MSSKKNNEMLRLIETDDGSHSLYLPTLNETYHSFHGALQESRHVFIMMGWHYFTQGAASQKSPSQPVQLLEIGFGTGLNALLTLLETLPTSGNDMKAQRVHYTTLEPYPIPPSFITQLNYEQLLGLSEKEAWLKKIHQVEWEKTIKLTEQFSLLKLKQKLEEVHLEKSTYDIIYYDAFAPSKQSELWDIVQLEKVFHAMSPNGVLVTYCAKGQFKRDLLSLGFAVETLPGPPGKKEMVRAIKQ